MDAAIRFVPSPTTLTIITTYQCTAACKQCCFESSPSVTGRLTRRQIRDRIAEAVASFVDLAQLVFSGGEAFLLKEDLYDAVEFATSRGLQTRIVSNGSWGKSERHAEETARRLQSAGLTELNISTGKDHQEWVPPESVINAAKAAAEANIRTLVTVEADGPDSAALRAITSSGAVTELLNSGRIALQCNTWMPFHDTAEDRRQTVDVESLRSGCDQVFSNAVVTPHDNLSACCGLTHEHIPEMRLGACDGRNMRKLY